MQALRYASRRALRATVVIQEPFLASARAYSSEAGVRMSARLNKEDRCQLAKEFIEKFKSENNGRLPTLSLLRKEVGGKYDVLKDVMQQFEKDAKSEQVATEEIAESMKIKTQKSAVSRLDQQDTDGATQMSAPVKGGKKRKSSIKEDSLRQEGAATLDNQDGEERVMVVTESSESVKDGCKEKLPSKKEMASMKDKSVTASVSKGLKETKSVQQADGKSSLKHTEKQKQSSVPAENTLEHLVDTLATDEDDDDSDVAAPEYQQSQMMQTRTKLDVPEVDSVADIEEDEEKQDVQAIKAKLQPKLEDTTVQMMQNGVGVLKSVVQSMADKTSKQLFTDGNSGPGIKSMAQSPPTTVVRVVNLPSHASLQELKAVCERVAKVHGVSLRRGRIVDVQFDVDIREMQGVLERLRKVAFGSTTLRVFPALRFSCESSASRSFKPRDVYQLKNVRNSLIAAFEQRFKFLCLQIEDYRELHNLKVAAK